jgi:murein DD-endopeptidase / murein LD-carboxypeptidase
MVKTRFRLTLRHLFILLAAFLLSCGACSRKAYPVRSGSGIDRMIDKRKVEPKRDAAKTDEVKTDEEEHRLKSFLDGGFGKRPEISGITPADIISTAYQYLGVPHCMGGTTKKCIDCSGLLKVVFAEHGISLPHNSEEQARYGRILSAEEKLREGDLLFFVRSYRTSRFITHSGIYVGNNRFIHTSSRGGVVITQMDNSFWNQRFVFATRIF